MFRNEKIRPYIILLLTFLVFSSKNIILYNEETLVAISFLAFVAFISHSFGNTIKDSFNERSQAIQLELQHFLSLRQDSLDQLRLEHIKVLHVDRTLNTVSTFTNRELVVATARGEKALNFVFSQQLQQKLKTLAFSKITLQQKLQQFMANTILSTVLVQFHRSKKDSKYTPLNREKLKGAIQLLLNSKQK
jgi:hypothetical protein